MIDETLDAPLRKVLDDRTLAQLQQVYGRGWVQTEYITPSLYWSPGDGTPSIVAESPAVAQAMGRCAGSRVRWDERPNIFDSAHPATCDWCDFDKRDLLVALDHAVFVSRCVDHEIEHWAFQGGREYVRATGRSLEYDNPAWRAFFDRGQSPSDLAHLSAARRTAIAEAARL